MSWSLWKWCIGGNFMDFQWDSLVGITSNNNKRYSSIYLGLVHSTAWGAQYFWGCFHWAQWDAAFAWQIGPGCERVSQFWWCPLQSHPPRSWRLARRGQTWRVVWWGLWLSTQWRDRWLYGLSGPSWIPRSRPAHISSCIPGNQVSKEEHDFWEPWSMKLGIKNVPELELQGT